VGISSGGIEHVKEGIDHKVEVIKFVSKRHLQFDWDVEICIAVKFNTEIKWEFQFLRLIIMNVLYPIVGVETGERNRVFIDHHHELILLEISPRIVDHIE